MTGIGGKIGIKIWPIHYAELVRRHLIRDIRPYNCMVSSCNHSRLPFDTCNTWMAHIELDHANESLFNYHVCPLCLETIPEKYALFSHLAKHLEQISLMAIPRRVESEASSVSGSMTADEFGLLFGGETGPHEPEPEPPFVCDKCWTGFPSLKELEYHMHMHGETKKVKVTDETLETPASTVSDGPGFHFCDICFKVLKASDFRYVFQQDLSLISTKSKALVAT